MRQFLLELGLTPNEVTVYEMLLREGASLAGRITQQTGIHRRNVYDCLERLHKKGLVGFVKENNRRVYAASDPHILRERLEQQRRELDSLLPTMLAQYQALHEKRETLFFRGPQGIKQVLQDQLARGSEVLVLATTTAVEDVITHFFPRYQLSRKEQHIPTRMLFDETHRSHRTALRKLPLCTVRFAPDINRSPLAQYIYGDTVALIVYSKQPIAILIRQADIAQGFRENFEALWRASKP